jgi:AraC-like DNA-binding protein
MFSNIDYFVAGSISLLAFLTLTNPREVNVLGNRFLAILLFMIAILIFDRGLFDQQFYLTHIAYLGITDMLLPIVAPTLYLSVVYFTSVDRVFKKRDLGHYVPLLLLLPFYLKFIFTNPEIKLNDYKSTSYLYSGINNYLVFQLVLYWFLSYFKLQKHKKNIQLFASNTDAIDLNWLKYFLWGIAVMIITLIVEFYVNNPLVFEYASVAYLMATYILAYYALRQKEIFAFDNEEREDIKEIIEEITPLQKQERFSETQLQALKNRLLALMNDSNIHLQEDLSLPKLAQYMVVSTHDLSYLLNEGFGQSFFEFINAYRVEEAKRLLLSEKHTHLNMIGIAYAAGFSSKTTFYTTFKKMTQQSPTEFQTASKKS